VVHILSKPYLLREYFIAKAAVENFVNRSSFIQPRVTEHVEDHKFSLLRVFCEVADEEGFPEIAETFRQIAKVEAEHERRYLKLLSRIEAGNFFVREEAITWQCRNCGYVIGVTTEAPAKCPACAHPQAFFEPKKENY
jgi:rubrerythrin